MAFENGKTYRFVNRCYAGFALNVFGTKAASTGRNVCLYANDPTDIMQDWVVQERNGGYRLHSAVNQSYVLDCSDGSLKKSYKNNAHLCITGQTSDTDSRVIFEGKGNNIYKIYLPGKNLYLTATNSKVNKSTGYPASTIENETALKGGTGGESNVYWAEGNTNAMQEWIVSPDVDGGTTPPDPDPGTYQGKMTLAELKAKFPDGKYWNHAGLSVSNNQDGCTSTACDHSKSTDTCNSFTVPGSTSGSSSQCLGFAEKCGYDFSGSNPRDGAPWVKSEDVNMLDSIKAGDIIRYYSAKIGDAKNLHAIFVTGVNGENVVYGECNNSGNDCKVHWGGTKTKKTLKERFYFVRIAPFELQ